MSRTSSSVMKKTKMVEIIISKPELEKKELQQMILYQIRMPARKANDTEYSTLKLRLRIEAVRDLKNGRHWF